MVPGRPLSLVPDSRRIGSVPRSNRTGIKSGRPRPFRKAYTALRRHFGPQKWWPARSFIEMCVGAVLTQNTSWTNVEKAIRNLKKASVLDLKSLLKASTERLAQWIRPTGYYNLKVIRLRSLLEFINRFHPPQAESLRKVPLETLRVELLKVHGIGPETADAILLYGVKQPLFVVDAYTRRIFQRHHWIRGVESYEQIRHEVESAWKTVPSRLRIHDFNEFHALIVVTAKEFCHKSEPKCWKCPLLKMLPANRD